MGVDLPEELLVLILIRLPVVALLRFKCVCKFWCSLISSSNFIRAHVHHNHKQQLLDDYNVLFAKYLEGSQQRIYSLHVDSQEFKEIETLNFRTKEMYVIGCVNGLVCLSNDHICKNNNILMFWNPSIRKYLVIPEYLEESIYRGKTRRFDRSRNAFVQLDKCFGFGYDALSDDYKVIMFNYYSNSPVISVYVFSLRRRSWRTFEWTYPKDYFSQPSCNVGNFVYKLSPPNRGLEIVSFDLNAEEFAVIPCPESVKRSGFFKVDLTIFRGSLGLLHGLDSKRFHLWVMKEEGGEAKLWMKLVSVDLDNGYYMDQHIVGFTMRGLMVVVGEGGLLLSSHVEDEQAVINVPRGPYSHWRVDSYKESLVLSMEGDSLSLSPPTFGSEPLASKWEAIIN